MSFSVLNVHFTTIGTLFAVGHGGFFFKHNKLHKNVFHETIHIKHTI